MLGDKVTLAVMAPGTKVMETVVVQATGPGQTVELDASMPGIVSGVVRNRKGAEIGRAVVGIANLVSARTEYRK